MWLFSFFEVVVVHFDGEDDGTHGGGEEVAQEERPVFEQQSLNAEEQASKSHQQECAYGDVVGFAGSQRVYGLWQIAKHHADRCCVTNDVGDN